MFVGFPRSSHSLVGSLLDAHPEACIAHEMDVLKYVMAHFSREQLFHMLLDNALQTGQQGREQTGYSYQVPGQYQGQYKSLRVIGDKRGGNSSRRLKAHPWLLKKLKTTINMPLRVIHVSRNPFDNISTMAYRKNDGGNDQVTTSVLKKEIKHYFRLADVVEKTRQRLEPEEFYHVRIEDFLANPGEELTKLCEFIGLPADDAYIASCTSILYNNPHRSRQNINWPQDLVDHVRQQMVNYPFLKEYGFDEDTVYTK